MYLRQETSITTDRLWLRDFHLADWPAVQIYAADPEVTRFVEWGPNTPLESRRFVERATSLSYLHPRVDFELAIIHKLDQTLIGAVSLQIDDPVNRQGWIGYCLRRDAWGNGYATEAAYNLLNYAFAKLALHRVWATAAPDNQGSINILQKIGMTHEGSLKSHKLVRGSWRDTELFAILDHEFVPPRRFF